MFQQIIKYFIFLRKFNIIYVDYDHNILHQFYIMLKLLFGEKIDFMNFYTKNF